MRGGLERWKRGVESHGVRQAIAYAFDGTCDAHLSQGAESARGYADAAASRFSVDEGHLIVDDLDADALAMWIDGRDPRTGAPRGRVLTSPDADLLLDGTINAPKSFSIAALLHPELAAEFEALQDRLRDRVIRSWSTELNARRGAGGTIRESLSRIEVVELKHRRSRALDPHVHRHLWLNVKVRGVDGKWSNVDSRVAMRFHTIVNAEGDLAARTDPAWRAALARYGYSIDENGEIPELAHVVKPLSRRSNQIEANRAMLLAEWAHEHPGHHPSAEVARAIDRRAWALGRPNKPHALDEEHWERLILDELLALDPDMLQRRSLVDQRRVDVQDTDVDLLARRAVVDADGRSTGYGGRFSAFDVRGGAMRAVAASGVVADRAELVELIERVVAAALDRVQALLPAERSQPPHVKSLMAPETWRLKTSLNSTLAELTQQGARPATDAVAQIAKEVLGDKVELSERQLAAAGAVGGTDRLVSVTGPAGSGKTAMLKLAHQVLRAQRRELMLVAPTKKAANVAARETGCPTASLHALLFDHGWRWGSNAAGAQRWTRLAIGAIDPLTGDAYEGPRRYVIREGDRIVVDEAGMVDLHAADALLTLVRETGAGLAMVGDHLQAAPVGHAGAMAALTRHATAVVELNTIHRFADPAYGALTLRLRDPQTPDEALAVARELVDHGHVIRVESSDGARQAVVERYFHWTGIRHRVAVVTASNDEADIINGAIQQRRIDQLELDPRTLALGVGQQRILVGDTVQTRRNDSATGVDNRAIWVVTAIDSDGVSLVAPVDDLTRRRVSREYAAQYLCLAYASTVHGAQGETTAASVVGPDVDAAGLYVGMTRGRIQNEAIVIAPTERVATERLAVSMRRGIPEVAVADSVSAARHELRRAARGSAPPQSESDEAPSSEARAVSAERALLSLRARLSTRVARSQRRASAPKTTAYEHGVDRLAIAIQKLRSHVGAVETDSRGDTWPANMPTSPPRSGLGGPGR